MKTKDAGLRIRVERELRDEFLEVCRAQDRPAAQVLREYMRDYASKHKTILSKSGHSESTHAYRARKSDRR